MRQRPLDKSAVEPVRRVEKLAPQSSWTAWEEAWTSLVDVLEKRNAADMEEEEPRLGDTLVARADVGGAEVAETPFRETPFRVIHTAGNPPPRDHPLHTFVSSL
tara:strand:- start:906 stop:1217 length:312 start_codon:yes stop_codon:yes gene_type:complete